MSGSTVIRELVAALGIEVDEASVARADSALLSLTKGAMAVGAAVAAAGAALVAMVSQTANAANEARLMATTAGVATDTFQELGYAAHSVGVDLGDLRDVFLDVSERAQAAKEGAAEYTEVFKGLGVTVTDAGGKLKAADVLFYEIADAFARLPPSIDRTAYASRLFGETGARLLPVLMKGSAGLKAMGQEARDLGLVFSAEAMKDAEDFRRESGRLGASLEGLRNTLAGPFLPLLSRMADALTKGVKALRQFVSTKAPEWVKRLGVAFDFAVKVAQRWRLIVVGLVSLLVAQYLPALAAITAAQWAWGSASLIAGARAALAGAMASASAVAALLPWALLAAAIILAADELYTFATGGDSVLGRFIKWLDKINPEDNPLVNLFKRAYSLLFDLTDPQKWKALYAAWNAFAVQIEKGVTDAFKAAWEWLKGVFSGVRFTLGGIEYKDARKASSVRPQQYGLNDVQTGALGAQLNTAAWLAQVARGTRVTGARVETQNAGALAVADWARMVARDSRFSGVSAEVRGPADMTQYFGRGGSAETAIASTQAARGGGVPGVYAPVINMTQTVQAAPGMSSVEVGNAAADRGRDSWQAELDRTYAAVNRR